MSPTEEMPLGSLPDEVVESVKRPLRDYSVGLVFMTDLAGSGTLVSCRGKLGVLTATHVTTRGKKAFDFTASSDQDLGFIIDDRQHHLTIPMKHIQGHYVGHPLSDEYGPDICFLELPVGNALNSIRAKRSFYPIDIDPEGKQAFCNDDSSGLWAMSYHIHEGSLRDTREDGSVLLGIKGWAGLTGPDERYDRDGFDYIEVGARPSNRFDLPKSFGGASGGGLWKMKLTGRRDGGKLTITAGNPVLAGVIFYEYDLNESYRRIRCHGPQSVYVHALQAI